MKEIFEEVFFKNFGHVYYLFNLHKFGSTHNHTLNTHTTDSQEAPQKRHYLKNY